MTLLVVAVLALAVSRLTRLIVSDTITEGVRIWVWRRYPASDTVFGDSEITDTQSDTFGGRVGQTQTGVEVFRDPEGWYALRPRFWGNVISCAWCAGIWVGIAVWATWWFYPDAVFWLAPLALSEIAGLLNDR